MLYYAQHGGHKEIIIFEFLKIQKPRLMQITRYHNKNRAFSDFLTLQKNTPVLSVNNSTFFSIFGPNNPPLLGPEHMVVQRNNNF
jgi:hypothetical protein